jgi:hypothetical protein
LCHTIDLIELSPVIFAFFTPWPSYPLVSQQ